jgi:hypothetical protein
MHLFLEMYYVSHSHITQEILIITKSFIVIKI